MSDEVKALRDVLQKIALACEFDADGDSISRGEKLLEVQSIANSALASSNPNADVKQVHPRGRWN